MSKDHESTEPARERPPAAGEASPVPLVLAGRGVAAVDVLALQRTAGNAAVRALLARQVRRGQRRLSRYTEIDTSKQSPTEWPAGKTVRVADDGSMAVAEDSRYGSHRFWAVGGRIDSSSEALKRAGSVIRLKKGPGTIEGTAPNGTRVTLTEVLAENVSNSSSGTTMQIWADCGKSARDVFGAGGGTGENFDKVTSVYESDAKQKTTEASGPKAMKEEIFASTLGYRWYWSNSAEAGWQAYQAMDPTDRDRFDRKTKINRYATPDVGEAFTMSSGGNKYPGVSMWNFHWGGIVMVSSSFDDRVTLENYSVSRPMEQNADWVFQMYGAKKDQTFHEQHLATKQHGDLPITLRVMRRP
jgi:hypothetical protein